MQEKRVEEGITVGELFRVIFRRVWILLGGTLACAALIVLVVALFVNGANKEYSMSYTLEFPGYENLRYPDGSAFRYQSVVSLKNLERVKNSDEAFANMNVSKMYEANAVVIEFHAPEVATNQTSGKYTITAKGSYFPSEETATRFLRKLAETPVDHIEESVASANYKEALDEYSAEDASYENKIAFLAEQRDYLLSQYSALIVAYGESYRVENRTLKSYSATVSNAFSENLQETLLSTASAKGFVVNADAYRRYAASRLTEIGALISDNSAVIGALSNLASAGNEEAQYRIAKLTEENAKLTREKSKIEDTVTNLDNQSEQTIREKEAFDAELQSCYDKLSAQAGEYRNVLQIVYGTESAVTFDKTKAETNGTTNLVVAAVAGVVIGFIATCIVICAVDLPAYLRKKRSSDGGKEEN